MEIDAEKLLEHAIRDGFREGVKQRLSASYNNPLDKLIDSTVAARAEEFRKLLNEAISSSLDEELFRATVRDGIRSKLASLLVQRFGGELEKQVNALKSDPATRARITLAIEEIVKEKVVA